jgi:hypothetical protein
MKRPERADRLWLGDLDSQLRRGICLFDRGYHWEAHEAWELAWHAVGRRGPRADRIKALIKLAAACVKIRQDQPHGVVVHARRAAELLRGSTDPIAPWPIHIDFQRLAVLSEQLALAAAAELESDRPPPAAGLRLPAWRMADLLTDEAGTSE